MPEAPATGTDPIAREVIHDAIAPTGFTVAVDTEADFTLVPGTTDKLMGAFTVVVKVPTTAFPANGSPIKEVKVSVLPAGKATLTPANGVAMFGNPYFEMPALCVHGRI